MVNDRSVAEAVVACLQRHGVEVMFSQSLPTAALLAVEAHRQERSGAENATVRRAYQAVAND